MATYEVSTWTELVEALETINESTESQTIKLTADIDCNDEIPEGVASTIVCQNKAGGTGRFTIDGSYEVNGKTKNHQIRNLRTHVSNPVNIFNFTANSTACNWLIKGLDFINLITNKPLFDNSASGSIVSGQYIFSNCRFVGKRNDYLINSGQDILNSCFFNVNCEYSSTYSTNAMPNKICGGMSSSKANFCIFVESLVNDLPSSKTHCSTCYGLGLNGCRIEGEVHSKLVNNQGKAEINAISYSSAGLPIIQNVMDCTFVVPDTINDVSNVTIATGQDFGVIKKSIRTDSGTALDASSWAPTVSSGVILETVANMKNPAQLKADGLDVIVPT